MRPRRPGSWVPRPGERRRVRWPKYPCCNGDRNVWGWAACDPGDSHPGQIAVSTQAAEPDQAQIFYHEVVHHLDRSLTEEQVDRIATGLCDFKRMNPDIDDWLTHAVRRG